MFKLDESKSKTFDFEYKGKVYSVPNRESLPMTTFRAIRKAISESDNSDEVLFDEIMNLFDEYVPEVMQSIDLSQAMELFKAYSTDGDGADLGKSSDSSD